MEKIINITTAGRVIPIYDSAYTALKSYLDSLHVHFAGEEGRDEIISDMESRISELMSEEIRRGSPAITDAHMEAIIASMGRVEDFGDDTAAGAGTAPGPSAAAAGHRRLLRNGDDQILGGVCSGIAAYFNVDPALIRIVFGILALGGWGTGIILYIALWVLVPQGSLKAYSGRRLFRLHHDKWIGGVCTGLGAYFGKDPLLFRLLFGLPLIGGVFSGNFLPFDGSLVVGSISGTFLLIYILLWVVLPYATTEFDKMQMRGEKIDLDSIRRNVQSGTAAARDRVQSWSAEVRESASRLSSGAASAARPVASGAASAIGRLIRAIFLFMGWALAFSLFFLLIAYLFGGGATMANRYLLLTDSQRTLGWVSVALFFGVPLLALITWLVRRSLRVRTGGRYLAGGFLLLWIGGIVTLVALVSYMNIDFQRAGEIRDEVAMRQPANGRLVLTVPDRGIRYSNSLPWLQGDIDGWDVNHDTMRSAYVEIQTTLSPDSQYHAYVYRRSQGRTAEDATDRASHLSFSPAMLPFTDSILSLPNGYSIAAKDGWRAQHIVMEVQVPAGKVIRLDRSVEDKLNGRFSDGPGDESFSETYSFNGHRSSWRRTRYRRYGTYLYPDTDYQMSAAGKLIALNGRGAARSERIAGEREEALEEARERELEAAERTREQEAEITERATQHRIDSIERVMNALERQRERLEDRRN